MRSRRWLACLLSLLMVGSAVAACQSAHRVEIGMNLHYRDTGAASVKRQFDLMAAMNVSWVRVDVDWSAVEPEQGDFDWESSDLIVEEALARRMKVLIVLAYTPDWARTSAATGSAPISHLRPLDFTRYATFARTAAQRYAARGVHHWEIWNEQNSTKFWPPHPDAGEYGALFQAVMAAIRGVDPKATVLIGGLTPKTDETALSPTDYLDQLYRNGTAQLADAVAFHPYSTPAFPFISEHSSGGFKDMPALRDVMVRHGDSGKKVWITEFGAATGLSPNAMSGQGQAKALNRARQLAENWDWVGPLIYYELVDGGTDLNDEEQNYGVLHVDLTPKPAAIELMNNASQ